MSKFVDYHVWFCWLHNSQVRIFHTSCFWSKLTRKQDNVVSFPSEGGKISLHRIQKLWHLPQLVCSFLDTARFSDKSDSVSYLFKLEVSHNHCEKVSWYLLVLVKTVSLLVFNFFNVSVKCTHLDNVLFRYCNLGWVSKLLIDGILHRSNWSASNGLTHSIQIWHLPSRCFVFWNPGKSWSSESCTIINPDNEALRAIKAWGQTDLHGRPHISLLTSHWKV